MENIQPLLTGEGPYSVIKGVMLGGHTFDKMIRRVMVKETFACIGYNLLTLLTLSRLGRAAKAMEK